jgi:hypothetical protein
MKMKRTMRNKDNIKKTFTFNVSSEFPKIIKRNLHLGIYDTSYSIEISAVERFLLEPEKILQHI